MRFIAAIAITMFLSHSALAQHQAFTVDPNASDVKMTLKTNHDIVNGTFHVQSGSFQFDRNAHTITGLVTVGAGTGNTGNSGRDKKMDKDYLKVDQYNTVTFAPKTFTGTLAQQGDSTIQVSGVFTLLGTPHDLTIPMQVHLDGTKATATAQFTIPYVQWGIKNPSFFILKADNDVSMNISLSGRVSN